MTMTRVKTVGTMLSSAANALFPILIIGAFIVVGLFLFKKLSEDGEKELA